MDTNTVYTIGYGNRRIDDFVALLQRYAISAVCDVRSQPYSARYHDFSRGPVRQALRVNGIQYVFLGKELGARPSDPDMYSGGKASYTAIAASQAFLQGLERIKTGLASYSVALMCAEKDPLDCHRAILIAPKLLAMGIDVMHVAPSGLLETQCGMESRLLKKVGLHQESLFIEAKAANVVDEAYRRRGNELSYDIDAAYQARRPR